MMKFKCTTTFRRLFQPRFPTLTQPSNANSKGRRMASTRILFQTRSSHPSNKFRIRRIRRITTQRMLRLMIITRLMSRRTRNRIGNIRPYNNLLRRTYAIRNFPSFVHPVSRVVLPTVPYEHSADASEGVNLGRRARGFQSHSYARSLCGEFTYT